MKFSYTYPFTNMIMSNNSYKYSPIIINKFYFNSYQNNNPSPPVCAVTQGVTKGGENMPMSRQLNLNTTQGGLSIPNLSNKYIRILENLRDNPIYKKTIKKNILLSIYIYQIFSNFLILLFLPLCM
jgi:hypothetical protein